MLLRAGLVICCIIGIAFAFQPPALPLRSFPGTSDLRSKEHVSERSTCLRPASVTLQAQPKEKPGIWTPDSGQPSTLWTPRGEVQIEQIPEDEMARPLLDSEWEIMFAASEDLRDLAKSGQLMEELTGSGEDLAGSNVTEIGLRPIGDAVDLDEVFREWKKALGSGEFNIAMATPTSKMISFVTIEGKTKVVDLDSMAIFLAGSLVGIDVDAIEKDPSLLTTDVQAQIQDLVVSVSRVMLRYALMEDVLKRRPTAGGNAMAVISRGLPAALPKERVLLPENAAANILSSDFNPPFELEECVLAVGGVNGIEGMQVSANQVDSWLAAQLGGA